MNLPGSSPFGGFAGACCGALSVVSLAILFLFGSTASESLSFGRNLSEVFRPASGGLFPAKPASFGGNNAITDFLSAVWTFHKERIQHGLQLRKGENV